MLLWTALLGCPSSPECPEGGCTPVPSGEDDLCTPVRTTFESYGQGWNTGNATVTIRYGASRMAACGF